MTKNVRSLVLNAAVRGAQSAAASDRIAIEPSAVGAVADRVARELEPTLEHLANAESFWRSRVSLGSLTSMIGGAIAIGTGIAAGSLDPEIYATGIAAVLGGGFALYGRWVASRPLGR